jgi:hypothetical protein
MIEASLGTGFNFERIGLRAASGGGEIRAPSSLGILKVTAATISARILSTI